MTYGLDTRVKIISSYLIFAKIDSDSSVVHCWVSVFKTVKDYLDVWDGRSDLGRLPSSSEFVIKNGRTMMIIEQMIFQKGDRN